MNIGVLFQEGSVLFEVEGNGFFYKQVRNMVRDYKIRFLSISLVNNLYYMWGKPQNDNLLDCMLLKSPKKKKIVKFSCAFIRKRRVLQLDKTLRAV